LSISVDPIKTGVDLKFTVKSIFSNSDLGLTYTSEEIFFPKAVCPDCTVTDPNTAWWNLFTLVGPEDEEIVSEQTHRVNDLNIYDTM